MSIKNNIISLFIAALFVMSCTTKKEEPTAEILDNPMIETLYQKDIEIRDLDAKTDTVNLENYDQHHRAQIFQLLAANQVLTPKDKIRAAWILQHTAAKICEGEITSLSPENFLLAYQLSSQALAQLERAGDTATIRQEQVKRIIALNYDRYLLFSAGYQKFGTLLYLIG